MKFTNSLKSCKKYLYHYTSCDVALSYILKSNTLMFNSFSNVNDPRESKKWEISPFIRSDLGLAKDKYEKIADNVSELLKGRNAKLLCFSRDNLESEGALQPWALFDRGFNKPSMWHHYGDQHNGVCLMFNFENLRKQIESQLEKEHLFHGEVDYTNQGVIQSIQDGPYVIDLLDATDLESYLALIKVHFNRWYKELFSRKLSDWSNESEYRWVYLGGDSKPLFIDFGDSLEGIVAGENVDVQDYERLYKHCVFHSADLTQLEWHNGIPKTVRTERPRKNGTGWFAPKDTIIQQ